MILRPKRLLGNHHTITVFSVVLPHVILLPIASSEMLPAWFSIALSGQPQRSLPPKGGRSRITDQLLDSFTTPDPDPPLQRA